jgi:hypothetical protein
MKGKTASPLHFFRNLSYALGMAFLAATVVLSLVSPTTSLAAGAAAPLSNEGNCLGGGDVVKDESPDGGWVINAPSGSVFTEVTVKTGVLTGGCLGSLTEDGVIYNSLGVACYTVSGIGTDTVTVTQTGPDYEGGQNPSGCQEISHIEGSYSTPPPEDVCLNLEGIQTEVPQGYYQDQEGNCYEIEDESYNFSVEAYCAAFIIHNDGDEEVEFYWEINGTSGTVTVPAGGSSDEFGAYDHLGKQVTVYPVGESELAETATIPEFCEDPFSVVTYCMGFTIVNENAFPGQFTWSVAGGPNGVANLPAGGQQSFNVDESYGGALVTVTTEFNGETLEETGTLPSGPCSPPPPPPPPPPPQIPPTGVVLIPVTGVDTSGSGLNGLFFNLALGFIGLGMVLHGLGRKREE